MISGYHRRRARVQGETISRRREGLLLAIGRALIAANGFILAFALFALVVVRFVIVPREERELRARFGSEYDQYMRQTGAMMPRLRTRDPAASVRGTAAIITRNEAVNVNETARRIRFRI